VQLVVADIRTFVFAEHANQFNAVVSYCLGFSAENNPMDI
jgi:hypothetical protein